MKIEFIHLEKGETANPEFLSNVREIYYDYDLEQIEITTSKNVHYVYPRNSFYRMEIY